jgi:hypothetical protein
MPDNQGKPGGLSAFLAAQLHPERLRTWRLLFYLALAVTALLNLLVPNHEPHFVLDRFPFFWPAFGLGVGTVMVFVVKRIIQPLIKRPEDHYGDV